MAAFCKEHSIEIWGRDTEDLAGITTKADTAAGMYATAICESCGCVQVDHTGAVVNLLSPPRTGNRLAELAHLIPKDEPVFVLRGSDIHAAATLRFYALQLELSDVGHAQAKAARTIANQMDAHPKKINLPESR